MAGRRMTLPNIITLSRIATCPVIFVLALSSGTGTRIAAFVLFLAAAASDIWDGYIARRDGLVTDMGKLLDPIADKLLLAATWIPIYLVSRDGTPLPWWGAMPLWVLAVIFGREIFITVFRAWAARRGVVIAAGRAGKEKALFQSLFTGGALLWYPLTELAAARGWSGPVWTGWSWFHGTFSSVTLAVAVVLTVYSLLDYLWSYRALVGMRD